MPFNLGPMEMVLVMVVLLLVFGAKRLPELGSGLGKGIREFKRSVRDIKEEVGQEEPPPQIRNPVRAQVTPPPDETPAPAEPGRSRQEG
ncbi:MAG TPA: twin-arginine translocase TatA/TatE family subunit [Longimicrobiales bacterium]|nr:twin-arginine translocase TatA/TatE family subunit [Longimicrobiales bacterium]